MKTEEQIKQNIENTFNVLDTIEEVKVNHFFKHKVLKQLGNQNENKNSNVFGFTPKLQLAALCLVLLMNLSTTFHLFSLEGETVETNIDTFAQEYSLQSKTSSLLN